MNKSNSLEPSENFVTTNTALAAFLQSKDYKLLDIGNSNPYKCSFIFEDSQELLDSVKEFELGTAIGNIPSFFYYYKRLIQKVK